MVVLRQSAHQISRHEYGVIVSVDEPPYVRRVVEAFDGFFDDTGDSDGGAGAAAEGVGEVGGVLGNYGWREGRVVGVVGIIEAV